MNSQALIIYNLLCKLDEKYLAPENIRRAILEGNTTKQAEIELVDSLCQSVITSLNFGDYKRAVKYLALTEGLCKRFFAA